MSKSDGGFAGVLCSEEVLVRGIMVLLEKQVHLQKDVGAGIAVLVRALVNGEESKDLLAAREKDRKAKKRNICRQLSLNMVKMVVIAYQYGERALNMPKGHHHMRREPGR